jgi:hypothetical protein
MYKIEKDIVPSSVKASRNSRGMWTYGYNKEFDIIVISKDGTIGDIYNINDLLIALPKEKKCEANEEGTWVPHEIPKELSSIKSQAEWNVRTNEFKSKYIDYIEGEFDKRANGHWFLNKGIPTYLTGSHYMYLQWTKIDVGLPEFRESNRIFYIFWEACKADNRCYGICYLKNRRSGFSFMSGSECSNIGTITRDARLGILSKTGADAKKLFTEKVVPMGLNYPFFFRPIQDGMDRPKMEISYRVPASRLTRKTMFSTDEEELDGLNTVIDWQSTTDNSYDGAKLKFLLQDESGKWVKPENILNNWKVTKTCLRLGKNIVGKCMMGSTSNALSKGGAEFKELFEKSNPRVRNNNGQTTSGLYALFIPMEWNFEGYIDKWGFPILEVEKGKTVETSDGESVSIGVIEHWNNEVESLKNDSDALNEHYRQFPRTESHAFRDESISSLFNLTKIYQQIDYNEGMIEGRTLTRGYFSWYNGEKDTKVIWTPDNKGRFLVSWIPPAHLQNNVAVRNNLRYPLNEHLGIFGCDSYDISGVVGGGGSNGALHGLTKFHMEQVPTNHFFLEYISRPQTAEIFYEDVIMAIHFYGMQILAENNKPRLLYHLKNRGYRPFSMNRPDKPLAKLSVTERELGGIPNTSEDVKQAHADAIQTYIEKYVGYDLDGVYRDSEEIGDMFFNKTLQSWAKFDINNRTKFDAAISSGLAIMAGQRHLYVPKTENTKISIKFAKYDNSGRTSQLLNNER